MGRQICPTAGSPKLQRTEYNLEDRISQLPDEILSDILSRLILEEAGRSSLLSRRWKDLWKFTTTLNFDPSSMDQLLLSKTDRFWERFKVGRPKYISWVNQVLKLHQSPSVEEFRIMYSFTKISFSTHVDEWIKFAVQKNVKRLEVDFLTFYAVDSFTLSPECYHCLKTSNNFLRRLTSLCLKNVNISGELLEHFLLTCPHLERVCLFYSHHLIHLKVVGPQLKLRHLELFRCNCLESIELCAPKLVSFNYFGQRIDMLIGDLPLLAELKIGGGYHEPVLYALDLFSRHLPQLENLELRMCLWAKEEIPTTVPELTNLKRMKLNIEAGPGSCLLGFTLLIEAASSLHNLVFLLSEMDDLPPCANTRPRRTFLSSHKPPLKHVEMCGFLGRKSDMQLARYLLHYASNLEVITLDPWGEDAVLMKKEVEKQAPHVRECVAKLRKRLPHPRAQLILRGLSSCGTSNTC